MSYTLTKGAIETIMCGGTIISPILQILACKDISTQKPNEKYRVLISDGIHLTAYAMLTSNLCPMVTNGEIVDNTIVKIGNYVSTVVQNPEKGDKCIMVILDLEVIAHGSEVGMRIGTPVAFDPAVYGSSNLPPRQNKRSQPSFSRQPALKKNKVSKISYKLTKGALETIIFEGAVISPILQILGYKQLFGQKSEKRYRIVISDGIYFYTYAMLSSNLCHMITNREIVENTLVKVVKYVCSHVENPEKGDKRIIVILDLKVIAHGCQVGMKIGNPVVFDPAEHDLSCCLCRGCTLGVESDTSLDGQI